MTLSVDRDDVQAFLDTLPADPERDRRADVLRSAEAMFAATLTRRKELDAAGERIAWELVDATGKRRDDLIAEGGTVAGELAIMPTTINIVTGRFAAALVAWCAYVHPQVLAAYNETGDQIAAQATRRRVLIADLTELESSTRFAERAAEVRAEYDALQRTLAPHHQRRAQAANIAAAIELDLRGRFGEQIRGANVSQGHVDQFVTNVTKAAA